MIGCQSHVLALAVKKVSKEHLILLSKMNDLCNIEVHCEERVQ